LPWDCQALEKTGKTEEPWVITMGDLFAEIQSGDTQNTAGDGNRRYLDQELCGLHWTQMALIDADWN
jgi:hypothetical protein